jgi:ankyrin repeat protein
MAQMGYLPLHLAAQGGHLELSKLLLTRGADIHHAGLV